MAVISDNHSTNVCMFNVLVKKFLLAVKDLDIIYRPSNGNNRIYLIPDPVHSLRNIRSNLFYSRIFIFTKFNLHGFYDIKI